MSFFFFKATTSALEVNFCFSFWSNLIQSRPFVCSVPEKKLCFFVFKVSIDHLFDNLESEKRNNCFGKKSGKRLGCWIQKSARTLVDRLLEVRLSLWIPLNSYPSQRTNFLNNLSKSQVFVAHNFWVICRNVWRTFVELCMETPYLLHQYGRRKSTKTSGVHSFYKSSFFSLEN